MKSYVMLIVATLTGVQAFGFWAGLTVALLVAAFIVCIDEGSECTCGEDQVQGTRHSNR